MIKFPRLKMFLTVFPLSDTSWGVRGGTDEVWRIKLSDPRAVRAFGALLPYLDGRTATEEILQSATTAGIHRPAAIAVLRQLETSSLIEEADAAGLSQDELRDYDDQIRFLSRFTQEGGAKYQAMLRGSRIAIVGDGALGDSLYACLAAAGFGEVNILTREPLRARVWTEHVAGTGPRTAIHPLTLKDLWPAALQAPQLLVVCQETHDPTLLEAVDTWSKDTRLPWLLVRNLEFQEGWVGPLFVPGDTASYRSLEARLQAAMSRLPEYQAFDAHVRATEPPPRFGGLRAFFDILAGVATVEAIKLVTGIAVPELLGKFLTINLWTWETEVHEVLRVPALDRRDAPRPVLFPWKLLSHDDTKSPVGA
jgi:bacteriocin biosynthesis cyclodehydratase domain-containing protein